jgi:hypothetical protein
MERLLRGGLQSLDLPCGCRVRGSFRKKAHPNCVWRFFVTTFEFSKGCKKHPTPIGQLPATTSPLVITAKLVRLNNK